MPFDLGDHPARLGPASRLIAEVGIVSPHLIRRSSDRALEQIADPVLQDLIGGQADRVFDPFSFQALVHAGNGEGCIGPEIDAQDFALIPHDDRLKHILPAVGAVHVAGRSAQRSRSPNWLKTNSG